MGNIVIDRMLTRLDEGNLNREDWKLDIKAFEITLKRFLNEKGYAYEGRSDLDREPEEKLKLLLEKEEDACHNPILLLPEGVKTAYDRLNSFMDSYHIGFIHDFNLNQNGIFEAEISLHIYPPSTGLGKNDVAERAHYESGLERLQILGLTLIDDCGVKIPATDLNRKIILDILGRFCEPRLIRFRTRGEEFDQIHFIIKPESIKYEAAIERNPITEEMIKADTLVRIKKNIKELYHAIGSINVMPELTNTCGYVIEGCFTEICDLLGIKTELTNTYHKRYASIRKTNSAIHEKERKLGNMITLDRIGPLTQELFGSIKTNLRDGIGYRMNDSTCITRYNGLKISADCIPSCSYYDAYLFDDGDIDKSVKLLEERMERIYDMIEPFPGERYIAFTKKNMDTITQWVHDTYHSELENIVIENRKGELYIKTFSFYIPDISTCL